MLYANQVKAARGLLGWSQEKLSEESGITLGTIKRMEGSDGKVRGNAGNVMELQATLEKAGIEFIPENGGGVGVRLKDKE